MEMVRVAVVVGAHGVKGEVKLRSLTAEPSAIARYGPLVNQAGEMFEIERLRQQKDDLIVSLKGVGNRNHAEVLKGTELYVPRERLPEAADDEVYVHDLVGLPVMLKDGSRLGQIVSVPNFGAGDLLEIEVAGRSDAVLVPFAASYVVVRDAERIVIDLPEGYLDEEV